MGVFCSIFERGEDCSRKRGGKSNRLPDKQPEIGQSGETFSGDGEEYMFADKASDTVTGHPGDMRTK